MCAVTTYIQNSWPTHKTVGATTFSRSLLNQSTPFRVKHLVQYVTEKTWKCVVLRDTELYYGAQLHSSISGNPAFPLGGHREWLKASLTGDDTRQGDTEFNAASIRWKAFDLLP